MDYNERDKILPILEKLLNHDNVDTIIDEDEINDLIGFIEWLKED